MCLETNREHEDGSPVVSRVSHLMTSMALKARSLVCPSRKVIYGRRGTFYSKRIGEPCLRQCCDIAREDDCEILSACFCGDV